MAFSALRDGRVGVRWLTANLHKNIFELFFGILLLERFNQRLVQDGQMRVGGVASGC